MLNLQQNEEIIEILDSLRGREIISSAIVLLDGASDSWTEIDQIAGHAQGGSNGAPVTALILLDGDKRFIEGGTLIHTEVWLCQWGSEDNNSGSTLLLIRK
jgi:hypothetical protein